MDAKELTMSNGYKEDKQTTPGTADRKGHVNHMLQVIESYIKGKSPAIFIFYGSRGSGKSTILEELHRKIPAIQSVRLLGKWSFAKSQPQEVEEQIRSRWQTLPKSRLGVILIEQLDEPLRRDDQVEVFHTFEQNILSEAALRPNILIIATATEDLQTWRDPDVRRRTENIALPPLRAEEVAIAAEEQGQDPKRAYQISCGHPQVLAWWLEDPSEGEAEITQRAVEFFLEDVSAKDRQTALMAAAMPQMDSLSISLILGEQSRVTALERVHMLVTKGLVHWDEKYGYYCFYDSAVRQLLARHLFQTTSNKFDEIHRIAGEYFREQAKGAAFLQRYIVPAIYHSAYENRKLTPEINGAHILAWLEKAGSYWLTANWEKILPAWENSAGEPAVREEIIDLIGADKFDAITRNLSGIFAQLKKTLEE